MLLAIDAGNTNTVFALCDGGDIVKSWRCETKALRTADEYAAWIYQIFQIEGYDFKQVSDVVIASVVPDANFNFLGLASKYFKCDGRLVTSDWVMSKIKVSIDNANQAGADLLVNAVACVEYYSKEAIIVDFGTATTLSVITADNGYGGGVIAPGVNLSLNALVGAAAKLPKISIKEPPQIRGTNTVHAMQSGIFWGYVSMIEGLIARLKAENGDDLMVIATGGLADIFSNHISAIEKVDKDLTLKGLIEISKE